MKTFKKALKEAKTTKEVYEALIALEEKALEEGYDPDTMDGELYHSDDFNSWEDLPTTVTYFSADTKHVLMVNDNVHPSRWELVDIKDFAEDYMEDVDAFGILSLKNWEV